MFKWRTTALVVFTYGSTSSNDSKSSNFTHQCAYCSRGIRTAESLVNEGGEVVAHAMGAYAVPRAEVHQVLTEVPRVERRTVQEVRTQLRDEEYHVVGKLYKNKFDGNRKNAGVQDYLQTLRQ